MPSTSVYGWPYPEASDPPNVPLHIQQLAQALEATLQGVAADLLVTTDAAPGTVAAGFSGSASVRASLGGKLISVQLTLTSNNAITASAGNIPDTTCYTLNAAYRPSQPAYFVFGSGNYSGGGTIYTDGSVVLRAAAGSIVAGDGVNITSTYLIA